MHRSEAEEERERVHRENKVTRMEQRREEGEETRGEEGRRKMDGAE